MILHLHNVGPIFDMEISVRPGITFIYGKNNIGKSYAATMLYLFLKNIYSLTDQMDYRYWRFFYTVAQRSQLKNDEFEALFENALTSSHDVDITNLIQMLLTDYFTNCLEDRLTESMRCSFGEIDNIGNKLTHQPFLIDIVFQDFSIHISEDNGSLSTQCKIRNINYISRKCQRNRHPAKKENTFIVYCNNREQFKQEIVKCAHKCYYDAFSDFCREHGTPYYLPASRSGLYRALSAFSQIFAALAKKRSFLSTKVTLPSISEQDSDYFMNLTEMDTKRTSDIFDPVASDIERLLLKGTVHFDQKTKQILFCPSNTSTKLELLGASSMIAELSPIVLYLRHIVGADEDAKRKKQISSPVIFIEEPEAHLHPEAQTMLVECFANLVKSGLKLVITSHSNYMFSKLNNCIAEKSLAQDMVTGYYLYSTPEGSKSDPIKVGDFGLDDPNFVGTSEKLYQEKLSIIEGMGRHA